MAINVDPDSRTLSSIVAPSCADPDGGGPIHSMLDHYRPASETPFKWCFAGGPLMAR